jgi:hypothetical protein
MQLDYVLGEVFADRWDAVEGPAKMNAARQQATDALGKYKEGLEAGNAAWAAAVTAHPSMTKNMTKDRYVAIMKAGHYDAAFEVGKQMFETGKAERDADMLMAVVSPYFDLKNQPEKMDADTIRAAAGEFFKLNDPSEPGPHLLMAQTHFILGEIEQGQAAAAKAVELAPEKMKERYQKHLGDFEAAAKKQ